MKKYYFITFLYGASDKTFQNNVIDEHPLEWQKYTNKSYPTQYVLQSWREITKNEYEMFLNDNGK